MNCNILAPTVLKVSLCARHTLRDGDIGVRLSSHQVYALG